MAERALIIVVDDESDALAAILDALTRRISADYRVVPLSLAVLCFSRRLQSKEENEEIALVIADQRMPEMTGRDFLGARPFNRPDSQTGAVDRMGRSRSIAYDTSSLCSRKSTITSTNRGPRGKSIYTRLLASSWRNGRGFTAQEWS
jgi:hypothetical protein